MDKTTAQGRVLAQYVLECDRQDAKFGDQSHLPDGTGLELGHAKKLTDIYRKINDGPKDGITWQSILLEEVYEAMAESDPVKLRAELVQVGAVVTAWVVAMDTRPVAEGALTPR